MALPSTLACTDRDFHMQNLPPFIAPSEHQDADSALAQVQHIYQQGVNHLRQAMRDFVAGADMTDTRVRAFYPFVRVQVSSASRPATVIVLLWGVSPAKWSNTSANMARISVRPR